MLGGVDKPGRKGVGGEKNGQRRIRGTIKGVEETTLEPYHRFIELEHGRGGRRNTNILDYASKFGWGIDRAKHIFVVYNN